MICNKTVFRIVQNAYPRTSANSSSQVVCSNLSDPKLSLGACNVKGYASTQHYCRPTSHLITGSPSYYNTSHYSLSMCSTNVKMSTQTINLRFYCSKRDHKEVPQLMDFPQVVWPNMFKTIRNWILSNLIIARYFDNEFNLPDFVAGSKQAVELVSGMISRGDVEGLKGLVTPEVISMVRQSLDTFTLKQRQQFSIKVDDIYLTFPYEVGVMFPNEDKYNEREQNQNRFVEITMCYHVIVGLKELQDTGVTPPMKLGLMPEYQDKIFICNYRFIREFTKGVQDDWTINAINHFKPASQLPI